MPTEENNLSQGTTGFVRVFYSSTPLYTMWKADNYRGPELYYDKDIGA